MPTQVLPPPVAKSSSSSTALNVWWFGGTDEKTEMSLLEDNTDSCELVAVRIDRTSANSRRISGEICVDAPLQDVWSILTDYDHLATHVPNLVESRRVNSGSQGTPGDGQYRCRLFQKGAQKIVGFEFGASVTMDMTEKVVVPPNTHNFPDSEEHAFYPQERKIMFKCVESPFFSEFDGEWRVAEHRGANGEAETVVSYEVEVRPRGPVPVLALEWRIREDVPTNLRAVKHAALKVGSVGVQRRKMRQQVLPSHTNRAMATNNNATQPAVAAEQTAVAQARIVAKNAVKQTRRISSAKTTRKQETWPRQLARAGRSRLSALGQSKLGRRPAVNVQDLGADWFEDETMAAYLKQEDQ
jgi:hypothetical protein